MQGHHHHHPLSAAPNQTPIIEEAQIEIRRNKKSRMSPPSTPAPGVLGSLESRTIPSGSGWSKSDRGPSLSSRGPCTEYSAVLPARQPPSPLPGDKPRAAPSCKPSLTTIGPPSLPPDVIHRRVGGLAASSKHRLKVPPSPDSFPGPRTLISITTRNHSPCVFVAAACTQRMEGSDGRFVWCDMESRTAGDDMPSSRRAASAVGL